MTLKSSGLSYQLPPPHPTHFQVWHKYVVGQKYYITAKLNPSLQQTCNNDSWMCIILIARQLTENLLARYIAIEMAENNIQRPFVENSAHLVAALWKTHIQHGRIDMDTRQCTVVTGHCTVDLQVTTRFYQHLCRCQFQICQQNVQLGLLMTEQTPNLTC